MHRVSMLYRKLSAVYGYLHWWPGSGPDEIIIGAVLTQQASWRNVEKSLENLKRADLISLERISNMDPRELAQLIKPSGFYTRKSSVLVNTARFIVNSRGLFEEGNLKSARDMLLGIRGIGPETADSILLYAFNKPVFVVDAYTARLAGRLWKVDYAYSRLQGYFEKHISDKAIYKNYHAVIVEHCKRICRKDPLCDQCAISGMCSYARGKAQ